MISKWFSGTMTPWNYGVSILIVATVLTLTRLLKSDPGFWLFQDQTVRPSLPLFLGIIGLTLFSWSLLDQYMLRNIKNNTEYSLLFPSWVIWFISFHQHNSTIYAQCANMFLVIFSGLWILFQHKESKLILLAAGFSIGIVALQYPALSVLALFGLSSLWIWNPNPLRNSLIWILGCLLPVYYWIAYHQITFHHLPELPRWFDPEIWLVNLPSKQIPWHLILILGASILGLILQFPWFGSHSRIHRLLNLQWIWLVICLLPVLFFEPGDPWRILAVLSPWGAWWISNFLEWKDGFWLQDAFLLLWLVLFMWGQ